VTASASWSLRGPNRRLLLAAAAVVVVAALVLAGFALRRPSVSAPTTDQAALGPVVLVPGYGGGTGALEVLARTLTANGRQTVVLTLAGDGTGDLRVEAARLDRAVTDALAAGAPSVDVVGYSAGGIVARLWATELGGAARARRIVLLGSPNHGTELAGLGAFLGGSACPQACQQLAPDSDLLRSLNSGDETPSGPQWVSLWTDQDQVVTPPDTARLAGAVEVVAQDVCPGVVIDHGQLPTAPLMQALVVRALGVALMTEPEPAQCQALSASVGP
jgi:triacylglycerol esterase/lipase EstA (alpha/beta hydrolase family)